LIAGNAASVVNAFGPASDAILDHTRPNQVAISTNDGMSFTLFMGFLRKQCGVNASKNHPCAATSCLPADLITSQCVSGVQSDPDYIAKLNRVHVEGLNGLVDDQRISPV
jgi:hypothetical protein